LQSFAFASPTSERLPEGSRLRFYGDMSHNRSVVSAASVVLSILIFSVIVMEFHLSEMARCLRTGPFLLIVASGNIQERAGCITPATGKF
jgi:hypothetical protein